MILTKTQIREFFDFTNITKVLAIIWECSAKLTIARFILLIITAILPLIPLYLMKLLLDAFAADVKPEYNYILYILIGFAVIKLLTIVIGQISIYVNLLQADIVQDHMSKIVITKTINTDIEYFDSDGYHDIFSRAISSSSSRPLQTLGQITGVFQSIVSLVAIIGILFTLHWAIIFVLIVIAAPAAIIRWHYANKMVDLREEQTQKERKAGYFKGVLQGASTAKEVRIFSYGSKLLRTFLDLRWILRTEKRVLYLKQARSLAFSQSFEAIAIIGALGVIAFRAISGNISVGDIAMYYGLFQKGQSGLSTILKSFVSMHESRRYLDHLFQFLELKSKILEPASPAAIPDVVKTIEFKDVHFTYPQTTTEIIKGINFNLEKGQILAIVGENGSGKSTLVKLLTRLYDKNEGQILINGKDITTFGLSDLRKKFTVIFQQFSKYNATVIENIQFADMHKPMEIKKIQQSSEYAHADGFIKRLPSKYKTALGRSFRQGEELSGGQWQKIALSRAFYKDADVIILDEPTSFIDPIAEEDIFTNLREVAKDKILILITHRIYNLKMADNIIVMDKGNIVEQGNHKELIKQDGLFKEMFDKQS